MRKLVGFQVLLACLLPALLLLTSGTASGTMILSVEYLVVVVVVVVGGGGREGGGGGAGGYRSSVTGDAFSGGNSALESPLALSPGTYPVVVGGGGAGGIVFDSLAVPMNGDPSSFAGIVSLGGGRGSSENIGPQTEASSGGSGGGGRYTDGGSAQPGAAGTSGQGFKGGDGTTHSRFGRGGGGGAGGPGTNGTTTAGGVGGAGLVSVITGSSVTYAVGGNGAYRAIGNGITGAPDGVNTGNGGGGSGKQNPNNSNANGTAGGSGIVILRYLTADLDSMNLIATGGALSTFGDYTIHTFTADDPFALVVPEPSTFALSALGLLGMGCLGRRRRKRS